LRDLKGIMRRVASSTKSAIWPAVIRARNIEHRLRKWVIVLGVAVSVFGYVTQAAEEDSCESKQVRFDGVGSLHYAAIIGDPETHIHLYSQIPKGCASSDSGQACDAHGYLIPGNEVAVGNTCGAWANVQFIGERIVSYGWIPTHSLQDLPDQSASETPGQVHYQFTLMTGGGTPVCEAYLQRINRTEYVFPPYCKWDVPLTEAIPGFSPIQRQPMTAKQVWPMISHGYSFLNSQGPNLNRSAMRKYEAGELTYDPDYSLSTVEAMLAGLEPSGLSFTAWLYPALDVHNNKKPPAIMLWVGGVEMRPTCYSRWDPAVTPGSGRYQGLAFILNPARSDLEDGQTRAVFGSSHNNPVGRGFVPVGDDIHFFIYRNKVYFDSFRAVSNEELRSSSRSTRYMQLEVFQRSNDTTRQMCRYEVSSAPLDEGQPE
jgi:hypothetical protein